ncbi:hypothetical protein KGP36_01670 [Patescibacteria group bacterium]|nr:hypothetical protein [Patescibacteria group bacterium]
MANVIVFTSPEFPQPDRPRVSVISANIADARKTWELVDLTQKCHGYPLRTAKLLLGATAKERVVGSRKEILYPDNGAEIIHFSRLAIRFQTTTQEDQFWQYYSDAAKTLIDQAFAEIEGTGKMHGVPIRDAFLESGGELKKSGIVDFGQAIKSWHLTKEEKKRWR